MATFSEMFAAKLARFQAGQPAREKRGKQRKAAAKKRERIAAWHEERARKRAARAETRYVLKVAQTVLGYKTRKLSADHKKALAKGSRRYWQSKRKAQGVNHG